MKNVYRLGILLVAVAVILGVSRLWAENKEKKAPRTRIGLLNLTYVIKNYEKYKRFQEEIKEIAAPFQKRNTELRTQLERLQDKAKKPTIVPAKGDNEDAKEARKEIEKKVKKIQRQIKDNEENAKLKLGNRSDHEMKILYLDVWETAQRYADAKGFDLVLHYNDSITKEDLLSAQNIARKLNTGALMPLYWDRDMDISMEIAKVLNENLEESK